MMADLHLAMAHHLLVFGLTGLLFSEFVLIRKGLSGDTLRRVARLDGVYGLVAVLVFIVGGCRVAWGAKGWDYYSTNPWFWAKLGAFFAVGLLSIPPTLALIRWAKAARANDSYVVPDTEITSMRRILHIELAVLFLIPLFAAAMARY